MNRNDGWENKVIIFKQVYFLKNSNDIIKPILRYKYLHAVFIGSIDDQTGRNLQGCLICRYIIPIVGF